MSAPLLSVVIASYNYARFLEESIRSMLSQSCQDFEIIIIDGGSTDDSVDIIRKYASPKLKSGDVVEQRNSKISYWVSEPDKGQSDAFNKGFAKAKGRFLTWLNADDVMLPGTVEKLKIAAERYPKCEWFVGGVLWLDPEMRIVNCGRGRSFSEIRYREGNVSVWGPSSFFTKRLLDAVGGVDERFHYTMDTDLWLRFAFREHARYRPFCHYAWGLRLHPDAKMSRHNFSQGGELAIGATNVLDEKQRKAERQKSQELEWRRAYFAAKPASKLTRLLSARIYSVLMARVDLLRWRGRHYLEVFK